jgi:pimeloyl-ACP methyl ester carboxylesterase
MNSFAPILPAVAVLVLAVVLILVLINRPWTRESAFDRTGAAAAEVDDIPVHYQTVGEGEPVVVFVHGWACDSSFWRKQAPSLAHDHRLILMDLPGHGRSGKPQLRYDLDLLARSVAAVLDRAGVDRAVLVGHSLGALVVRQTARRWPERVEGLVLVDGAFIPRPSHPDHLEVIRRRRRDMAALLASDAFLDTAEKYVDSLHHPDTPPRLKREIKEKMLATPKHVAADAVDQTDQDNFWDETPVHVPTLIVNAEPSGRPSNLEAYMRGLFPNADYVQYNDVGHFLMLERPERFNRLLKEFLDSFRAGVETKKP